MIQYTWYAEGDATKYIPFAKKQAKVQTALADRLRQKFWNHNVAIDASTSIRLQCAKIAGKWLVKVFVSAQSGTRYFPRLMGQSSTLGFAIVGGLYSRIAVGSSGEDIAPIRDTAIAEKVSTTRPSLTKATPRADHIDSKEFALWLLANKHFESAQAVLGIRSVYQSTFQRFPDPFTGTFAFAVKNGSVALEDLNTLVVFAQEPRFFFQRSGEWYQAHQMLDYNANTSNVYNASWVAGPDKGTIDVTGVGAYTAPIPTRNIKPFIWCVAPVFSERRGAQFGNGASFLTLDTIDTFTFELFGVPHTVPFLPEGTEVGLGIEGQIEGVCEYWITVLSLNTEIVSGQTVYKGWFAAIVKPYVAEQWNGTAVDSDVYVTALPIDDGEIVDLRELIYPANPRIVSSGLGRPPPNTPANMFQISATILLTAPPYDGLYNEAQFLGCTVDSDLFGVGGAFSITTHVGGDLSNVAISLYSQTQVALGFTWDGNTFTNLTPTLYATMSDGNDITLSDIPITEKTLYDGTVELARSSTRIYDVVGIAQFREFTLSLQSDFALLGSSGSQRTDIHFFYGYDVDAPGDDLDRVTFARIAPLQFSFTCYRSQAGLPQVHNYGYTYKGVRFQSPSDVQTAHIYASAGATGFVGANARRSLSRDLAQKHITAPNVLLASATGNTRPLPLTSSSDIIGGTYTVNYYSELTRFPFVRTYGKDSVSPPLVGNIIGDTGDLGSLYLRTDVEARLGYIFWWRGDSLPRGVCIAECYSRDVIVENLNYAKYGDWVDGFESFTNAALEFNNELENGVVSGEREPAYAAALSAVASLMNEQTEDTWLDVTEQLSALAAVALAASKVILVNNFANVQLQDELYGGCRLIVADYPEPKTPLPGRFFRP